MKKVIVRGPALSQSGYGEQTRFALRALRKHSDRFDIYLINTPWGSTGWIWQDDEERSWLDHIIQKTIHHQQAGGNFDISLQVTIPSEWQQMAPINIGYTAGIETTKLSPSWFEGCFKVNKILATSNHAKTGIQNTKYRAKNNQTGQEFDLAVETPIEVVPYPVRNVETKEIQLDLKHNFNFLMVAQWGIRKNVESAIKCFVDEFRDKEVGLVLKLQTVGNCLMDREFTEQKIKFTINQILGSEKDHKCSIHLLHGDLSLEEMAYLYKHPKIKAFYTLTHGEGFGLPIFEAVYNGLPVVAPSWSGQEDFIFMPIKDKKSGKERDTCMIANVMYDLKNVQQEAVFGDMILPDSQWCFPREYHARMVLREVHKNYGSFKSQATKLQKYVQEKFEANKMLDQFANAVEEDILSKVSIDDIPKISLITSVFKGDEFIENFLEDITRQTIFKDKCELVLVNANSPGNEEEVIKKYMEKYPDNIKYIKLDKDPGIYACWNIGIKNSSGEFISNANLDDRKAPNSLEQLAKSLMLEKDVDVVYTENLLTNFPNETWENNTSNSIYPAEEFSLEAMLRGNPPHCMPMWRKSLHDKFGYFEENYRSASDWEFWLRCAFGNSKMKKVSKPLGLYYFNPKGMSTNKEHDEWKRKEEKEIFKKYITLYQERNS